MMKPRPLPGVAYLKTDDPMLIEKADRHQFEVFSSTGYTGCGPVIQEVKHLPSLYYIAAKEGEVVGCVRVVEKSIYGFTAVSCFDLWPYWKVRAEEIYKDERCEEILFSTVTKDYRRLGGSAVILNLYRLVLQDALRREIKYWFTAIDSKQFPYFTRVFNFKFEPMGDPQDYLGAPTIPTVMNIQEGLRQLQVLDPELEGFLTTKEEIGVMPF